MVVGSSPMFRRRINHSEPEPEAPTSYVGLYVVVPEYVGFQRELIGEKPGHQKWVSPAMTKRLYTRKLQILAILL